MQDSDRNTLTEAQQEYFKTSKVRDEDGRLMVMLHGTPYGGFTVFKSASYFTQDKNYVQIKTAGKHPSNVLMVLMALTRRFSLCKKINGTYYISEAVADNSWHKLWVETAYINKRGITQIVHAEKSDLASTSETHSSSLPRTTVTESAAKSNSDPQIKTGSKHPSNV